MQYNFPQYSDEWWSERLGKPSASNGKKLVTSTGLPSKQMEDYAIDLAADMHAGEVVDKWDGNSATRRGTELEPEARSFYEFSSGNDVVEVGMFSDMGAIASPDGCIGDDGLLEIKCLSGRNHIKTQLYYKAKGVPPTSYIAQVQMQMLISKRSWVDLLFFHPLLPSLTIRVYPDAKVVAGLKAQITACNKLRDETLTELGW